ncbi:BTB/POZ and MATH domain-containing protein 1 [Dichanthelium oligosanthes]|uniref:BTB/POZ and MATH domain-containing protein 1 n=1 Tax=Dichanthelium oligosanthes TaxID=888268 RepID=A0A1E5USB8_9POAL|nr:BTB/POZ and MATH domain-containing protein 1 [Dichanthelium oligosanthes]
MAAAPQPPRTRTASRCTTGTAHATHTFVVEGFSLHMGLGAGRFIRSAAFTVGGFDWCVRIYPDGLHRGDSGDSFCICLELLSEKAEVRALYYFRLMHHAGAPWPACWRNTPTLFTTMDASKNRGLDLFKYIGTSDMKSSGHIHDDRLVIECDVTVVKEAQVAEAAMISEVPVVPPSDLSVNLGKLLESEEGADVKFIVQGEIFAAHKIVIAARSPVFKAELYGPVGEGNRECITIEDMQALVFKALLHFIYTDSLPAMEDLGSDDKEMLKHLLVAADRYAMERLKLICEGILCGSLDVENVATTLSLADQHNCSMLKDACIDYINSSDRINEVVASQGYLHLKRACPSVFVNMWEKEKVSKCQKS